MSFLITGFGRSGTSFLSAVLNQSPTWTVMHEPRGSTDEKRFKRGRTYSSRAKHAFSKDNYISADVNGVLSSLSPLSIYERGE